LNFIHLAELEQHDFLSNTDAIADEVVVVDIFDDGGIEVFVALGGLRSPISARQFDDSLRLDIFQLELLPTIKRINKRKFFLTLSLPFYNKTTQVFKKHLNLNQV